ncbi:MAG: hypothetical protein AAAB36_20440, partial [Ensifer adhaerens]
TTRSFRSPPNGSLKTYPGVSHGMLTVNADVLNADLLEFSKNSRGWGRGSRPRPVVRVDA